MAEKKVNEVGFTQLQKMIVQKSARFYIENQCKKNIW
jgi:hypothetical protein